MGQDGMSCPVMPWPVRPVPSSPSLSCPGTMMAVLSSPVLVSHAWSCSALSCPTPTGQWQANALARRVTQKIACATDGATTFAGRNAKHTKLRAQGRWTPLTGAYAMRARADAEVQCGGSNAPCRRAATRCAFGTRPRSNVLHGENGSPRRGQTQPKQ
eukprot:gene12213-biopygen4753